MKEVETDIRQLEIGEPEPIVSRTKTGRVRWTKLAKKPKVLKSYVQFKARELIAQGYSLTNTGIEESGNRGLKSGVKKYYPGGINGLKIDLMFTQRKLREEVAEADILVGKSGRILWASLALNPERLRQIIQEKARDFIAQGHRLTIRELKENGEARLRLAAKRFYEGGLLQLQRDLAIEYKKPQGYWNEANIERESMEYFELHGELTTKSLNARGRIDLRNAIATKYPGSYQALWVKLGINPPGYIEDLIAPELANEQLERLMESSSQKRANS